MGYLKPKHFDQVDASSARDLIRRVRQATRRRYTAEEKIRIVMEGIRGDEPVSAICRREGISANVYYKWLKASSWRRARLA